MNKKRIKYALRIGRKYDQKVFEAEVLAAGMVNARPDYRYEYVVATWYGDGWNFGYYRTALEALKHGRFAYAPLYFTAMKTYSRLMPMLHTAMLLLARWEANNVANPA